LPCMTELGRPKVVISRCIEFDHCRYNGDMIGNELVRRLKGSGAIEFIPVCMESEIGLGVPRDPVRIVQLKDGSRHLIQPTTGKDVTDLALEFNERFMTSLKDVDGFILKSRSPSCGIRDAKIYPMAENAAALVREAGLFGGAAKAHFPFLAIEDENRLRHVKLAEHFLTRVFTFASWRKVDQMGRTKDVVEWHADNKLLLMMYSQKEMRALGNLVGNREGLNLEAIKIRYGEGLHRALANPPRCTSPVNVLHHCLGYVSDRLSKAERDYFLQQLEMYRDARIPLSACLGIMRSWIIRFQEPYLMRQTFFQPFPEGLLEVGVTDSCEWRDLSDKE
jgi:uncharacterized protein YbgA (DUF1722 family)/uncharacterized protein YbbK (DUF523 family)